MAANHKQSPRKEGFPKQRSALPGRGGLTRIVAAAQNSFRGIRDGLASEAALRQEFVLAAIALPFSFFIASSPWIWIALVASLLFVLIVEFLNTAVERLCNHVTPEKHEAIRITKDLASASVFFALLLSGLTWTAALLDKFSLI